ncbi:MAG: AraC family transcriptional regulator [Pseudomonas sp.]|uniref:AraC family transcriptional regulator n=1 Tax=Pseudomonas sp. TaxID=306 RepID=UPI00339B2103
MHPVAKALWYIESRVEQELSLAQIADVCGLSRFALSRLFAAHAGCSVMRYARARRLSEAARLLAAGAPNILGLALDSGYASHEAFTRAFREHLGRTPEQVRAQASLDGVQLMEPIRMKPLESVALAAPRFEQGPALLIAGLSERFTFDTNEGIPTLWSRFARQIETLPGRLGWVTYGLCCNPGEDGSFEYLAGVQVRRLEDLPAHFTRLKLPARRYAVFTHQGPVTTLHQTVHVLWNHWLPASGLRVADAPEFERYSEDFNPLAGTGVVDIWIPLEADGPR